MKKIRYLYVIVIFAILLPLVIYIIQALKPLDTHFDQRLVEFNGTYELIKTKDKTARGNINFIFLDENGLSEMAEASNIKSLSVIDENDNIIAIEDWDLFDDSLSPYDNIRLFNASIDFEKEGTVKLKTLLIEFMDGINEYYDLGSLGFSIISDEYYRDSRNRNPGNYRVLAIEREVYTFSGVLIGFKPFLDKAIIKDIDLGLRGFVADTANISVVPGDVNSINTKISNLQKSDYTPEWLIPFDKVEVKVDATENYPITLKKPVTNELWYSYILCIPFICTDTKYVETTNVFYIKIHAIIDGEEYFITSNFEIKPTLSRFTYPKDLPKESEQ